MFLFFLHIHILHFFISMCHFLTARPISHSLTNSNSQSHHCLNMNFCCNKQSVSELSSLLCSKLQARCGAFQKNKFCTVLFLWTSNIRDNVFDNPLTLTELSHVTFILLRSILKDDRQARYIINSNILENIIAGRLLLSIVQSQV